MLFRSVLSERYFHSRPRQSQLGALTSRQSRPVATRAELDQRLAANARKLAGREIPLPASWGGYVLRPDCYEFW